jgi:hypothetical protein
MSAFVRRFAVFLAVVFASGAAAAHGLSPVDGNQLLKVCTGKDASGCEGFILGALGMHLEDQKDHPVVCPARSATPPQLRDILVKFLLAHPETRSLKGAGVTILAMHQAFPCPK